MRQPILVALFLSGAVGLSACGQSQNSVDRKLQDVNVVDETNLNEVMMTVADPNEAVNYFQRSLGGDNSGRIDLQRGLAASLVRAKRYTEAVLAWRGVVDSPEATLDDKVELADALIRANQWDEADKLLDTIPPTHETFKRYRLEAMIADSNQEWKKADSFYEIAVGLTTEPSGVLNNWGYSKLTRGDYSEAERLFSEAITQDGKLFTAKNNLVLSRAAQRNYTLPIVPMSQIERAQLLHTMGLSAVKQGDIETAKGILREAIETHPQHFEAAVRSLEALEANVQS